MKIGVLSDTHDQINNIKKAVNLFNQHQTELVIHCGDWVAPFTLKLYEKLTCPMKGVFGNNDGDKFRLQVMSNKFDLDLKLEERFLHLKIDGREIAVFHGDYQEIVDALVLCNKYDAVFHGHTHIRVNQVINDTLSLNPGALFDKNEGKEEASVAIYDTQTNTAEALILASK